MREVLTVLGLWSLAISTKTPSCWKNAVHSLSVYGRAIQRFRSVRNYYRIRAMWNWPFCGLGIQTHSGTFEKMKEVTRNVTVRELYDILCAKCRGRGAGTPPDYETFAYNLSVTFQHKLRFSCCRVGNAKTFVITLSSIPVPYGSNPPER